MYNYIERFNQLGYWIVVELSIDLLLTRLPDGFVQFVLDYETNHNISTIPKLIDVLKIAKGKMAEKKGKETASKETSSKGICFYCGQVGCWKRNCKALRSNRKLTKGESDFQVGNGVRVVAAALWTYVLNLPSDLCLNLEDCYYVLALTRNINFV